MSFQTKLAASALALACLLPIAKAHAQRPPPSKSFSMLLPKSESLRDGPALSSPAPLDDSRRGPGPLFTSVYNFSMPEGRVAKMFSIGLMATATKIRPAPVDSVTFEFRNLDDSSLVALQTIGAHQAMFVKCPKGPRYQLEARFSTIYPSSPSVSAAFWLVDSSQSRRRGLLRPGERHSIDGYSLRFDSAYRSIIDPPGASCAFTYYFPLDTAKRPVRWIWPGFGEGGVELYGRCWGGLDLFDAYISVDSISGKRDTLADVSMTYYCATPVGEAPPAFPSSSALRAWPNPSAQSVAFQFVLPNAAHVQLAIYDQLGRKVATVLNQYAAAGESTVSFDESDLPPGIYFAVLEIDRKRVAVKIINKIH